MMATALRMQGKAVPSAKASKGFGGSRAKRKRQLLRQFHVIKTGVTEHARERKKSSYLDLPRSRGADVAPGCTLAQPALGISFSLCASCCCQNAII